MSLSTIKIFRNSHKKFRYKIILTLIFSFCEIINAKIPPKDSLGLSRFSFLNNKKMGKEDCDACGCAINNNSIGVDGLLNRQYVGIKYFSQHYKVKENIFVKEPNQNQYFNSIQLLAKIPLGNKIIFYAIVPYHINTKEKNPSETIEGLGDMTILGNYYLLNNRLNGKNSPHRLLTNFGLKIPTGKFDAKNATGINPSFQLGTGSWDFLTSLNYQYIKEKFAFQIGTDYILKNENSNYYKFGNQWNFSINGFYFFTIGLARINPKLSFLSEFYEKNEQLGEKLPKTDGKMYLGKTGIEINYKNLTFGSDYSTPIYADLAEKEIKPISRFSLFFTLNF